MLQCWYCGRWFKNKQALSSLAILRRAGTSGLGSMPDVDDVDVELRWH